MGGCTASGMTRAADGVPLHPCVICRTSKQTPPPNPMTNHWGPTVIKSRGSTDLSETEAQAPGILQPGGMQPMKAHWIVDFASNSILVLAQQQQTDNFVPETSLNPKP